MNKSTASLLFCGALSAVIFAGCQKGSGSGEAKSGPVVATVGNETITAAELKKRLDETSPFLRARYNTAERKKEFLENLIRNELLAQEAQRQGLDKSPAVREQMKRAMIQELIKKQLDERLAGADISDADLKKFYDTHLDEFQKPERARVFSILLPAKDAKEKTAAKAKASALLKDIEAREKKGDANAFQSVAMKESKDPATAPVGGDMHFRSKDELTKDYNTELADAAFALKNPGDKSVVETPTGIEILKLQVKTVALNRTFEESKESIRSRMARERRSHEYDEWVKKLREQTKVTVNDDELAKVNVDAASPAQPGFPGGPMSGAGPGASAVKPATPGPVAPKAPAPTAPAPTAASKMGGQ